MARVSAPFHPLYRRRAQWEAARTGLTASPFVPAVLTAVTAGGRRRVSYADALISNGVMFRRRPLRPGNINSLQGDPALRESWGSNPSSRVASTKIANCLGPRVQSLGFQFCVGSWTTESRGCNDMVFFLALGEVIVEIYGLPLFGVLALWFNLCDRTRVSEGSESQPPCRKGTRTSLRLDLRLHCYLATIRGALRVEAAASLPGLTGGVASV